MRKTVITMAAALLVGGCSPKADNIVAESAPAGVPMIGVMDWPNIRYHCTFFAEGHEFDADDESTWRFIFVKAFTPSRRDAWAVVTLDGERQIISEISRREAGHTETRRYQSVDNPEIELELTMTSARGGNESPGFRGTLQIIAPTRGEPARYLGDCRR